MPLSTIHLISVLERSLAVALYLYLQVHVAAPDSAWSGFGLLGVYDCCAFAFFLFSLIASIAREQAIPHGIVDTDPASHSIIHS